jgi:glycosyltransferase involved in cell wall biosynthesis
MARILLWHGYLLSGSGSNIYTANIAREWRARGHDVLILCQDKHASRLRFVDAEGDFAADNQSWSAGPTGAPSASGICTVVRPAIGGLLPVYVFDRYEAYVVKRFVDLSRDELERYTAWNVDALVSGIKRHRPEAIITGHEVMGPYIAREACARTGSRYVAKLHGSALEYAVKVQERYRDYARWGLSAAAYVAGGSRYMIAEARSVVPGWEERAVVVNPGCDVELFGPVERASGKPVVGYVGKFIAAKGVHHFLAALGLTATHGLHAEIVGYGSFEARLMELDRALRTRDSEGAERVARSGEGAPLGILERFLAAHRRDAAYWRRAAAVPVMWRGRLEHEPLARVLPWWDVLVVPSVVPEAFGMVAAEAAACGVLPVVPRHSGIGEVGAAVEEAIGAPGLLTYDPADPISGLAQSIDRVLSVPVQERRAMGRRAVSLARERWSWTRVADRLLELATEV